MIIEKEEEVIQNTALEVILINKNINIKIKVIISKIIL